MNQELQTVYEKAIVKIYGIEHALCTHLMTMIQHSTNDDLKKFFTAHLEETKEHGTHLATLLQKYNLSMQASADGSFTKLLQESLSEIQAVISPQVKDDCIIACALVVEHIEIANYETLILWSNDREDQTDNNIFKTNCAEEDQAVDTLTGLATGGLFTTGVVEKAVN